MEILNRNLKREKRNIVVGLSGGVDSFMALLLLQKQGWDCVVVHLNLPNWMGEKTSTQAQVKKVCQELNVAYYILNVRKEFEKKVVAYFIKEYKAGRTPNPCIICNPGLKFKKLLEFAKKQKINYVATGHYALTRKIANYQLLKSKDKTKDQTYYLSFLTQKQLSQIVFPLGNYTKKQVIKMAKEENIDFLIKQKQSQDFCYCPGKLVTGFLKEKLGLKPGKIIEYQEKNVKGKSSGEEKVLGRHQGLHFYTIGQRKRIGLSGGPYFVQKLDVKKNQVIVTKSEKDLWQKEILLSPFNFISGKLPQKPIKMMAKIRYGHLAQKATLYPPEKNKLKLVFDKPQRAVTPGQFAVFYQKNICLGGAKITSG